MKFRARGVLALASAFALQGCGENAAPQAGEPGPNRELRPIVLQADWFPQPEHGGFFQALERGFYRDAGLDVSIVPGGPRAQVLQKVALGRMEFGLWRSDDVTVAVSRGLPLVCVAAVFQRDPQALMFHAEHPVRDFQDLAGRTVMAGTTSVWVRLVEKKFGVRVRLTPVTFSIAQFMRDPFLVQQCLVTSEPFQARRAGADVGTLLVAESGHEPYHAIIANRDWVAKNPEVAKAFVRASLRGWADFLEGDPGPAFAAIARRNPQHTPESMAYSRDTILAGRLATGLRPGEPLGHLDAARLGEQAEVLYEFGLIDRAVNGAELIAPGFPVSP